MGLGLGMRGTGWKEYLRSTDEKPEMTRNLMRRVLGYGRPYRLPIVAMFLLILGTTALGLLTPLILRRLIDRVIPAGDVRQLILMSIALLIIPAASGLFRVWQRSLNARIGEGVTFDLRVAVYSHLQRMSMQFFTRTKTGELISRLNNDVLGAQNAISGTLTGFATNLIQCVSTLAVMFLLEWHLTIVSIVILPLFIGISKRLARRLRDLSRSQMEANASMNAAMQETLNIGGAMLVKLFGRIREEEERFKGRASVLRDLDVRRAVMGASFMVIIGLVGAVGTSLVYGVGGFLVIRKVFTVGTIVAFGAFLTGLYASLQGLANNPVEFATSVVSFERVFEVIDMPPEIREKPDPVCLEDCRGDLVFEDVSFCYEGASGPGLSEVRRFGQAGPDAVAMTAGETGKPGMERRKPGPEGRGSGEDGGAAKHEKDGIHAQARPSALEHVSFSVKPGELTALVGPSGAGKTTVTYLIPRLVDPTGGRILIDGHDLRDVGLASLTGRIGMVTQETHLFHDTIRMNLLYAKPEAGQAEIEEAAKAANMHDFITGLPDAYETVVGERGYRLSGGEKQRVALARVILKDPRILVLDEATSSLDSESEALIRDALKRIMAGRTSIVVAHRLSTILAADQILVLDRGRVVERGTHRDLLSEGGLYAQLFEIQFQTDRI
jgi:ATP-binding cassette, subfamily B, bacterial